MRLHSAEKYSCGAVVFVDHAGKHVPLLGDSRVTALRLAFRQHPLPDLFLSADRGHGNMIPITWHDVDWESCGERVTT